MVEYFPRFPQYVEAEYFFQKTEKKLLTFGENGGILAKRSKESPGKELQAKKKF